MPKKAELDALIDKYLTLLTIYRKFKELGALLMAKAAAIRPSTVVRLWRPSVLALCTYLQLKPIKE